VTSASKGALMRDRSSRSQHSSAVAAPAFYFNQSWIVIRRS
jgi:hypothetical protein